MTSLLAYATPKTLRDFGYPVKDREDRGLGKRGSQHPSVQKGYGSTSTEAPRTRSGKTQPGGRVLRRVLARLEARQRDFMMHPTGSKAPGSRKP